LHQWRHFFQQGVAHRSAVTANGAGHFHGLGNDVGRRTRIDCADTDHAHALGQVGTPTDQGLQAVNDAGAGHHRINAAPGRRTVGLLALDDDTKAIAAVQHRTGLVIQMTGGIASHHMHAEDGFDLGRIQGAVADHRLRANQGVGRELVHICRAFFRRLEQEHHRARHLVAMFGEHFGGAQQHGGVGVMPTGVHHRHGFAQANAGSLAGKGQAGHLLDGQCVHVGPQGHYRARQAALEHGDHAGFAHLGTHLQAQGLELLGDQGGGLELLIAHFRVLVNGVAQVDHLRIDRSDGRVNPAQVASLAGGGSQCAEQCEIPRGRA